MIAVHYGLAWLSKLFSIASIAVIAMNFGLKTIVQTVWRLNLILIASIALIAVHYGLRAIILT